MAEDRPTKASRPQKSSFRGPKPKKGNSLSKTHKPSRPAKEAKSYDWFQEALAAAISRELELPNALVTVAHVSCDDRWQSAKAYVSVLPANMAGTALRQLKKQSGIISRTMQKQLKMRKAPRLFWAFDPTEKYAGELEDFMKTIDQEEDIEDKE
jgi:ribosome-binding factor A